MNAASFLDNLPSGVSAIVIAGYIGAVIYQGNLKALELELLKERGYLEFVIALFIVHSLMNYAPTGDITNLLLWGSLIALALKTVTAINQGALGDFVTGKIGMFDLLKSISAQQSTSKAGSI